MEAAKVLMMACGEQKRFVTKVDSDDLRGAARSSSERQPIDMQRVEQKKADKNNGNRSIARPHYFPNRQWISDLFRLDLAAVSDCV